MQCAWRLDGRFRAALYAVFSVLFLTGVAWLAADRLKGGSDPDMWSATAPVLLMVHGGAGMLALMLLGALVPVHLSPAWRRGKNRLMGVAMGTLTVALIITAYGLYYIGSDTFRLWTSDLHIGLGLVFPAFLIAHVATGRHRSQLAQKRSQALSEPCTSSRQAAVSCNRTGP